MLYILWFICLKFVEQILGVWRFIGEYSWHILSFLFMENFLPECSKHILTGFSLIFNLFLNVVDHIQNTFFLMPDIFTSLLEIVVHHYSSPFMLVFSLFQFSLFSFFNLICSRLTMILEVLGIIVKTILT